MLKITCNADPHTGKVVQEYTDDEGNKQEIQIDGITKVQIQILPDDFEVVLTVKRAYLDLLIEKGTIIPYDRPGYPPFKQKVINFFKNLFKKKVKPVQAWKPRER
jgi:hypothetical protein